MTWLKPKKKTVSIYDLQIIAKHKEQTKLKDYEVTNDETNEM